MRMSSTVSGRHLRNVVCSCGTNGFSAGPARPMMTPSARRMAVLTGGG